MLVCVYGNRAFDDTLVELEDIVKKNGFSVYGGFTAITEHSIVHKYAAGRPDNSDEERIRYFAKQLHKRLENGTEMLACFPGNRPYRKYGNGLIPAGIKNCVYCSECIKKCPVQAIDLSSPLKTDKKKCISCMRCVEHCPVKVRRVNSVMFSVVSKAIQKSCLERKEELFL